MIETQRKEVHGILEYRVEGLDLILNRKIWNFHSNVEIEGRSGIRHSIPIYAESRNGSRMILMESECSYKSILRSIGYLHVMTMDLGVEHAFVLCKDFNQSLIPNIDLSRTDIKIVSGIHYVGDSDTIYSRDVGYSGRSGKLDPVSQKFKRDRTAIMAEIMQLLTLDQQGITSIIYRCNLNYRSAKKVLDELMMKKYVEAQKEEEKTLYGITKEGADALKMIRKFYEAI